MESGSQRPARFNIVNFPGKLEKNKQTNNQKKLNHKFLGEGEACKVNTVLKVITTGHHHHGDSVPPLPITEHVLEQEGKFSTELQA